MKRIVSLVAAMLVASASMVHAVKQEQGVRKVVNMKVTRAVPAGVDAAVLASAIVAADLSNNANRANLKQRVVDEFNTLASGADLLGISEWCTALVNGVGANTNGRQLIADIIAVQPVLASAVALLAQQNENTAYNSGVAAQLEAFKNSLQAAARNNANIEATLQLSSALDHPLAAALTQLSTLLGTLPTAPAVSTQKSSWDELGDLLNFHP